MRLVIVLVVLSGSLLAQSYNKDSLNESIQKFQKELNTDYSDSLHSPLSKADRLKFKGHDFYPLDLTYCVIAELKRTPEEKIFKMKTTTDRLPEYVKFGEVHFKIKDKKYKLNVYKSEELSKRQGFEDYLFLPFKDLTSGKETYGGGRFIDLKAKDGDKMIVDFNKAYNPYCAYSDQYSCPVPPPENFLETEVKAGIKLAEH